MKIDRPVFCFHINREIHKFLKIPVNLTAHRAVIRCLALTTLRPLYASHAQVIECYHDDTALLEEIRLLAEAGYFISISKYPTTDDFLESRRALYGWDRPSYPMYFQTDRRFPAIPTNAQGDPDTTGLLRGEYAKLFIGAPPRFANMLNSPELRALKRAAPRLRSLVTKDDGALTSAFFRRDPQVPPESDLDRLLGRVLPIQFTTIYSDIFDAYLPTGIPQLSYFETDGSFPYLDFVLNGTILAKLGLDRLLTDSTVAGTTAFLAFRSHNNFHHFVAAKDTLLELLEQGGRNLLVSRSSMDVSLRRLEVATLSPSATTDPLDAAAALWRASEVLCERDNVARHRREGMPDVQPWKGRYLIFTATDLEDYVLRAALAQRGFSKPIVVHEETLSYGEYFRSDIGKLYHVRTSAGAGGASGAFIMGKNAIQRINPEFVISVGICFGLDESKQAIGDVVVSEMIHDYERQRFSLERPEDRGATREGNPRLLSRARASLALWNGSRVHFGTVLSGEKLVDDQEFLGSLRKLNPPGTAGEMEAWGLSAVCHEMQKPFLMVKGICDWGYKKSKTDQEGAAKNAADFLLTAVVV